jgi:L-ascorbate metabolism protein UlaG (beta-lactamase superfamily)
MLGTKWFVIVLIILLLLLFVSISPAAAQKDALTKSLNAGEASIWYLHHSGWAVKTQHHFLIFDYIEESSRPEQATLDEGWIDPREFKGQDVFVFVSHSHGDHFDQTILDWEKEHDRITYIFGWDNQGGARRISVDKPRAEWKLSGMEIFTIGHDFDGIPEAAFLIKVDGLVLFHSGDHGSVGASINPVFKDNIDYLAQRTKKVDIAFISQFGSRAREAINVGDLYTINTLKPNTTFPMHAGGGEDRYKKFAAAAAKKKAPTQVVCAEARGDLFFYGNGVIAKVIKGEHDE